MIILRVVKLDLWDTNLYNAFVSKIKYDFNAS